MSTIAELFGKDYEHAHLDNVELPKEECVKIFNWLKKPSGILYFSGNPGLGKTYLLAAVCSRLKSVHQHFLYFHEKQLFSLLRETMGAEKLDDWEYELKKKCDVPWVMLDDLGSTRLTEWREEVLFSFLDYRSANRYPTIITSNLFIQDLSKKFPERFMSRIRDKRNVIIELIWKDKRV